MRISENHPMEQNGYKIYEFESFRLDPQKRLLSRDDGTVIPLMPKAFDTLLYLVENSGRVIDKDEMFREVWPDTIVEENNLTQNISILRKTFGEKPGQHRFIVTVPGRGYRFVADVRNIAGTADIPEAAEVEAANGRAANVPTSRFWFVTLALTTFLGLGSLGFYLWSSASSGGQPIRTIAVLPFKPLTMENRNESMELGMADSLISRLSEGEDLIVRPLFSVRRFTSPDEDPVAAGRSLAVEAVLEGSIQIAPEQVRVSARLFRVSDGKQIWAEQFDETRTNIFELQDRIAGRVASALNVRLGGKTNAEPSSFEAYESYMLGRFHATRLIMPEVKKGISYYERAIKIDPNYALAHVGIAEAQRALVMSNDLDPQIAFAQARSAAARAVELNPDISETHAALGMIAFIYDWDWQLSEEHLTKAIQLNPNNSEAHIFYAHLLSNIGRHEEALREARRARELNPVSIVIRSLEGLLFEQANRTDEAIDSLETAVEIAPEFWLSHHLLASSYIQKGRFQDAIKQSEEAKRLGSFQTHSIAFEGFAYVKAGNAAETRRMLDELLSASRERYVPPCHIAMLYTALGENEKALDHLEIAYRDKDVRMVFLKVERKWDALRSEPRFIELMRRMKFD